MTLRGGVCQFVPGLGTCRCTRDENGPEILNRGVLKVLRAPAWVPIHFRHDPRTGGFAVKNRVAFIAAAALMIGGGAACSSGNPSAKQQPGTLPPGTAQLTIDGKQLPLIRAVDCAPAEEYLTTI